MKKKSAYDIAFHTQFGLLDLEGFICFLYWKCGQQTEVKDM